MCRCIRVRAAVLKQKMPTAPANPAPIVRSARMDASAATFLIVRPAAVAAASRSSGPIIELKPSDLRVVTGLRPTTKKPRDEADTDNGGEGGERPGLHRLDQGVGRGVAQLGSLVEGGVREIAGI